MQWINIIAKKFKVYHYISFEILVDSQYDHYKIRLMVYLKVIIQNTVFPVPKYEITCSDFSLTQLHKKQLIFFRHLDCIFQRYIARIISMY